MLQLAKQLVEKKGVAESTANAYIKSLYTLNGRKPFKNLTFLKNTEEVDKIVSTYAESTQRALYACASSVLSLYKDKPTFKKVYAFYFDKVKREKDEEVKNDNHEKTEKQKEAWIEWDEVKKHRDELQESVNKFITKKTIDSSQYDTLQKLLILSLYTDIQPRRNMDYLDMYIVKKWTDKMPNDKNYLDMATKKFIYNKYKTAKKWGSQTQEIPANLWEVISTYIKYQPLYKANKKSAEPVKFLVAHQGEPLTALNSITRVLNKIFGKRVGSSMLRHIYLSNRYGNVIEDQEEDARAMGHSVAQQREYVKIDKPKNEVVQSK